MGTFNPFIIDRRQIGRALVRLGAQVLMVLGMLATSALTARADAGITRDASVDAPIDLTHCGGEGERACTIVDFFSEGVPVGCQAGLKEVFYNLLNGTCLRYGTDGYPTICGGENQRACLLVEKIPSCKAGLAEIPFPGGNCTRPDADGFPPFCGGNYERPCTQFPLEHLLPCKAGHFPEEKQDGSGGVQCRAFCGQNGQRACGILDLAPQCAPGLAVQPGDFNVCGRNPVMWGETDANEVPRGGPFRWRVRSPASCSTEL